MKKILVATIALLVLTGCSTDAGEPHVATDQPETAQETAPSAETPESELPQAVPEPEDERTPEQEYLDDVRRYTVPTLQEASDEQLITAGNLACDQLADGENSMTVRVVDGEEPDDEGTYTASMVIADSASVFLCD